MTNDEIAARAEDKRRILSICEALLALRGGQVSSREMQKCLKAWGMEGLDATEYRTIRERVGVPEKRRTYFHSDKESETYKRQLADDMKIVALAAKEPPRGLIEFFELHPEARVMMPARRRDEPVIAAPPPPASPPPPAASPPPSAATPPRPSADPAALIDFLQRRKAEAIERRTRALADEASADHLIAALTTGI